MNIDLNIENYDLQDILNLFKLDYNFNTNDLINAKKIVLKTHPDKSGLDKDIFLFYCKAFRILKKISDFKNKEERCTFNKYTKNDFINNFDNETNKEIVDNLMKTKKNNFNKWFNNLFEKLELNNNQKNGYGEWLKSDEDLDNEKINNINVMHEKIENKKKNMSKLIKKSDYNMLEFSQNQSFLIDNNNYNSDIFTNLNYQDLKNAHTESLIPVCHEDFQNKMKFNNVNLYKEYRDNQNLKCLSKKESEILLNQENSNNEDIATNLAFKLLKEEENYKIKNKLWWSNLKLLS